MSNDTNDAHDTVAGRLLRSGGSFQRTGVVKSDPEIKALLSKLVPSHSATVGHYTEGPEKRRQIVGPDLSMMERISEKTATNIIDSQNLLQTLPDVEMAMQVTVSAILAPKDLIESTIYWRVEPGWIPSELVNPLLDVVKDYFTNSYKISDKLPDILRDVLYLRGSRPIMLLPESSIDHLINSGDRISHESLNGMVSSDRKHFRNLGFLGNPKSNGAVQSSDAVGLENLFARSPSRVADYQPSIESLKLEFDLKLREEDASDSKPRKTTVRWTFDPMVSVVDNPQVLLLPSVLEKLRQDRVQDIVRPRGLATEAFDNNAPNMRQRSAVHEDPLSRQHQDRPSIYRPRQFVAQQTLGVTRASHLSRESIGHPTEFHLPSECVIPVHLPSDPEKHLGYFLLIDRQGNFLIKTTETDYFNEMAYNIKTNRSLTDQMISNVGRQNNPDADWYSRQVDIEEMTRIYSELMELELTQRLRNGIYGGDIKVARPQEIYQIMFSRALAGMHTQLLYVPAELMTYIAFDYNQHGIGVSLLQRSKILGGLRAIMLFADIMAGIKNSVGNTVVDIVLDEEDPDPVTSLETIMHEFAYGRSAGMMPLGTTRPRDIVNYMKQASVQYSVSGNPRLPTVKVSVEDKPNNRVRPDQQLQEMLKKNHLNALGVSPETVDASQGPEFATSVVANNLMFAKRVLIWQKMFMSFMQDHCVKYTLNSRVLMDRLREIVQSHKDVIAKARQENDRGDSESARDLSERHIDSHAQNDINDVDSVIIDFLAALRMELPKPDQGSKRLKKEDFENEISMIETGLKYYIDSELLKSLELGDMEEHLDTIVAGVKAHFVRDWMRNESILPQLNILTESDGDEPALDMAKSNAAHVDLVRKNIGTYILKVARDLKAWEKESKDGLTEVGVDPTGSGSSYDDSSSGSDDTGGGSDDGMGGMGDDDFGDDLGGGMDAGDSEGEGEESGEGESPDEAGGDEEAAAEPEAPADE